MLNVGVVLCFCVCVCAHSNCFPFSILVTLGNDDGSGFTHLRSSVPVTFCNTQRCVPTWPCMGQASRALKNPVVVPAALKNRVLMSSLFIPVLGFSSLFLTLAFLSLPLTHSQCPDFTEMTVNCLHSPPLTVSLLFALRSLIEQQTDRSIHWGPLST